MGRKRPFPGDHSTVVSEKKIDVFFAPRGYPSENRKDFSAVLSAAEVVRPIAGFLTGKAASALPAAARGLASLSPQNDTPRPRHGPRSVVDQGSWSHLARALRIRDKQLGFPHDFPDDFPIPLSKSEMRALFFYDLTILYVIF